MPSARTDSRVEARPTTTAPQDEPATTSAVDDGDLGRAFFPTVAGAPGSIVLTETGSCAVREFDLPTGLELPNVVERSTCQLWAAPVTAKVAVGVGEPVGDAVPFRFVDLGRPNRDLGPRRPPSASSSGATTGSGLPGATAGSTGSTWSWADGDGS